MSTLLHPEWRGRLEHWKRTLTDDFYQPLGEISWEAFRTMDHLRHTEVIHQKFEPVSEGFTWGKSWEYCWFKATIVLPEEAAGKRIVMDLVPNGESTLFINGKTYGAYRKKADWPPVQPWEYYEDNLLTACAAGGETFEVLMETYAGHFIPGKTGPVLDEAAIRDTLAEGARVTLGRSTYGVFHEDAYQLFMDVDTLDRLYGYLPENSLRAMQIGKALKQFTQTVDFEQPQELRSAGYRKAREELRPVFEAKNGDIMPKCYAFGQSHLDLAWLWPLEETHRKTARTFAAQVRLMEQYPEYKYLMTQPASYEMCRRYYPDLFDQIKEMAAKGQWLAEGALWVEPDLNLAGGEALIRQFLYGKRYFKEEFGVDSEIVLLPDTFGYTAALPQIMKKCGAKYFATQKILWTYNDWDPFPYRYFNWQGIDGSQVASYFVTYETPFPNRINEIWDATAQPDTDSFMLPFGYGDGGGGATRDHVEYTLREKNLQGIVPTVLESPNAMFHHLDELGGPENTYVGELYFCAHRGTFTTQALVKKNNRLAEFALREMEFWGALAQKNGYRFDAQANQRLWKELLLHQFHDILPGSSIERVNDETHQAVGAVITEASAAARDARQVLTAGAGGGAVTVFNSLSFERTEQVLLPARFENGARTAEGTLLPVQKTAEGCRALVTLPSCGAVSLYPAEKSAEYHPVRIRCGENGAFCLENEQIRVKINSRGEVTGYVRKDSGREFVGTVLNRFRLYKDVPRDSDAWDIDSHYAETECGGAENITVTKIAEGLEGVLKVTGTISSSAYTQYIRLNAGSDVLRFETEFDWRELHRLLKVDFDSTVHAENAINEIQFGYIERPTHKSRKHDADRFEVCNHRYSALNDGAHGVALMNDCKYGISMNGSTLSLTLLRAAIQPQLRADNGINTFTYAFSGWDGCFAGSQAVKAAHALNVPPAMTEGSLETFSALCIDRENILLDTLKPAEDAGGDLILRFYEAKKAPVRAAVKSALLKNKRAYICDMLENVIEEIPVENDTVTLDFHAFEIKTVRIG